MKREVEETQALEALTGAEERIPMNFLYAAYGATWVIHIVYLRHRGAPLLPP